MARKARSASKMRKTSSSRQEVQRSRSYGKSMPRLSTVSTLNFHEVRAPRGTYVADTPSFHYVIKPVDSGWELCIYERTNGSGEGQAPGEHEWFSSYSKPMDSKDTCIAVAQAFHHLGDSFNEFAHGYCSRLDQALHDVENPPKGMPVAEPRVSSTSSPSMHPQHSPSPRKDSNPADVPSLHPAQHRVPESRPRLTATYKQIENVLPEPRPKEHEVGNATPIARRRVYVDRSSKYFHASERCKADRDITHWCTAADAYRSHLRPCPTCSIALARALERKLGASSRREDSEQRPLRLIRLETTPRPPETMPRRQKARSKKGTPGRRSSSRGSGAIPYGSPSDIGDIRFSHRTAAEWGTSSFRQHPEEFLGTPTDDDHDWRGRNSLYE